MNKNIIILLISLFLIACGGGGGATDSSTTTPTDSNIVFSVFAPSKFSLGNTTTINYKGTDTAGGKYTATFSEKTQAQTVFLTQAAIPVVGQLQFTNTASGASVSDIVTSYFSTSATDRRLLGTTDSTSSTVSSTTTPIPQTAKIGDFGVVGTYTDNAGNVEVESWRLDDGGNGNAKAVVLDTQHDQSGTIIFSSTTSTIIDKNGNRISEKIVIFFSSLGVTITLNGS